jgi:hypothetical protein
MNQIPTRVIYIVVIAIASLCLIGVSALSASLFIKSYADPSILSALISITSGLVGSLVTLLSSPRAPAPGSLTTTTTTNTPPPPTPPNGGGPPAPPANGGTPEVRIVNQPSEPIPTTEIPEKP